MYIRIAFFIELRLRVSRSLRSLANDIIYDIQYSYQTSDMISNIWIPISNIQVPISDIQVPISDIWVLISDVRDLYLMSDIQYLTLDKGQGIGLVLGQGLWQGLGLGLWQGQ